MALRRRDIVITRLDGDIAVTVPAGEIAVLDLLAAQRLRTALAAAANGVAVRVEATGESPGVGTRFAVSCHDALGRERTTITMANDGGRITIVAPAGGVAVFTPLQLARFRAALGAALTTAAQLAAPSRRPALYSV
jgi:hypothetical protein